MYTYSRQWVEVGTGFRQDMVTMKIGLLYCEYFKKVKNNTLLSISSKSVIVCLSVKFL